MTAELNIWTHPGSYVGYNPEGHIIVLTTHRDADALTRSNWDAAAHRLIKAAGIDAVPPLESPDAGWWNTPSPDSAPPVYHWEASCSMFGWYCYLMVRPDAPVAVLQEAQSIADDLAAYPSLDDDTWSELEDEEAGQWWISETVRGRANLIREANKHGEGISLFAARRESVPSNDGYLDQMLRAG